jgi:hypothetical protein
LEKAYALLGVYDFSSLEEIEEAYRNKKRLYDPVRFVHGSSEWQFACARSEALDNAYRYAAAAAQTLRKEQFKTSRKDYDEAAYDDSDELDSSESSPLSELIDLSLLCPVAVYLIQLAVPTIFSDLLPRGIRGNVWFLNIILLGLSYLPPSLLRFVLLKRPIENFRAALFLFPVTLLFTDLCSSSLLRPLVLFSSHKPGYIPAFYLMGWSLFILLYAHCAILKMSFRIKKRIPFLRRAAAYTLTLALSVTFSLSLCVAFNGPFDDKKEISKEELSPTASTASTASPPEDAWQTIELLDAGTIEIPGAWYVENNNGKLRRIREGNVVEHIREALTARPYGQREDGLDFALELLVYWWSHVDGRVLPLPRGALDKVQDHQLESFQQNFPDVTLYEKTRTEREGRAVDVLTVETRSIPHQDVRFKNLAFEYGDKLYSLTVGYPAYEEHAWASSLDRILQRWRPEP